MMRIMSIHPSDELYGSDRMFISTVNGLSRRGIEMTVGLPSKGALADLLGPELQWICTARIPRLEKRLMSARGLTFLLFKTPLALVRCFRAVRQARPDVLYVNTIIQPWWLVAAKLARIPSVIHVRESEQNLNRYVGRLLYSPLLLCRNVVFNSSSSQRTAERYVGSRRSFATIYNGKDLSSFLALPWPVPAPPLRLLYVGRISHRKGVDILPWVVDELRQLGIEVTVTLAGDCVEGAEEYLASIHETIRELRLESHFKWLGFLASTETELARCNVVVVPSRQEPFGTVAVEAMAAGRPVVVSDVEGLSEIVSTPQIGLKVAPDDIAAWTAALARLATDRDLSEELGRTARAYALETFGENAYLNSLLGLLETGQPQ